MERRIYKISFMFLPFVLASCAGIQPRYYRVQPGDSLAAISSRYDVPVEELKRYNSERLAQGLTPGSKLYIPFEDSPNWDDGMGSDDNGDAGRAPAATLALDTSAAPFSWPVSGNISSTFGKRKHRMHEGIDIAARKGTPVKAARSGHVIYATSRISGYGKMVIIRHADSFSTVYAHLSKIDVKKGQFVARGSVLGLVGRTGHATGNHLHFEVRNHRVPVDPLLYLQGQYAANKISSR